MLLAVQPLVALTLVAVIATEGGNEDNPHTVFQQDDDIPGKPIGIGKSFTRFALPGGQFRVFYAVLDKHNALDLIRVHCVIEKSGHGEKDRNFVQVTVSNGRTSATFSIPDSISNGSLLYEGSRTVQPLEVSDFEDDQDQIITATVSSRVLFTVSGSIRFVSYDRSQYNVILPSTYPREKFLGNQRVGYVRPISYRLLTAGIDAIRVLIESGDDICAKLTLSGNQDEHDDGVQNRENHEIMEFTRRLDLVLYRGKLKKVMLMHIDVYPDDSRCGSETSTRTPSQVKLLNITWSAADEVELLMPVSILTSGFLLPIVFALAYATMSRSRRQSVLVGGNDIDAVASTPYEPIGYLTDDTISTEHHQNANAEGFLLQRRQQQLVQDATSSAALDDVEGLAKTRDVSVSCERPDWSWASTQFAVILLPILSLIFSVNTLGHEWKDDQCFHNYACSVPVWIFTSFNHIFSNIGYVISSVFFLIFVKLRKSKPTAEHGAYANYGLEVSMGLSLMCEALASSIYHICPNSITYNLDTPFIEVACVLLMLKLYGNRRMTITPQLANIAVTSVLTLDSIVTMSSQVSIVRGLVVAVLNVATISGICLLLLGPHLSLDFLKSSSTLKPSMYSAVGTVLVNAFVTAAFTLLSRHIETTQVVTVLCILNTFLYLGYYLAVKCWSAEKWCKFSSRCICASVLLWTAALFFFLKEETDWALTPAQSRAMNRPCVLLNFFDYHDLWHISSALASLILLIGVSSLDDDLCAIPTSELAVF